MPGTLAYISPERLAGEDGDGCSDVWAVGVMLWEALAGGHPFWKPSLLETGRAIEEGAPSLETKRPDLPDAADPRWSTACSPSTRGSAHRRRGSQTSFATLRPQRRTAPATNGALFARLGWAGAAASIAG